MYFFYVLYSLKDHRLYKGFSKEIGQRFISHSLGGTKSTSHRRPLVLIYCESFESANLARKRESWSKSSHGGPLLKELLQEKGILDMKGRLNFHVRE